MNRFYIREGKAVESIEELHEALLEMSDEAFNHHVNPDKNDFAAWIKDIHGNDELSRKISSVNDKESMIQILEERKELRDVLTVIDTLLEKLPEEDVQKFAGSEDFILYKDVMRRYR